MSTEDEIEAIRNSGLFDADWYMQRYRDVKILGMDPLEHYVWLGVRLKRDPSPHISAKTLLEFSRDLDGADGNPLAHYLKHKKCQDQPATQTGHEQKIAYSVADTCRPADVDLEQRIAALATSRLIDAGYICHQVGAAPCDEQQAARYYYAVFGKRRIKPNPLFDPVFYAAVNNIDHTSDPVWHYLNEGASRHLPVDRLFNGDWYKTKVPEAAQSSDLLEHYWSVGYKRGILPVDPSEMGILPEIAELFFLDISPINRTCRSKDGYSVQFKRLNMPSRFVPLDFSPLSYQNMHTDIEQALGGQFFGCLEHYLKHGVVECRAYSIDHLFGFRVENRSFPQESLMSLSGKTPLCVLMHLYYPDLWDKLNEYLYNIDVGFDFYINLVDSTWTPEILQRIRAERPDARVYISENAGRDIGGYIRLLDTIDFDRYVAFVTLHSKKSPQFTELHSEAWRRGLLDAILGSKEKVRQNVCAFLEDEGIGMIGAARHRHTFIGKNEKLFQDFLDVFNIAEENRSCEYVSGTMMMVRSEIMQAVYQQVKEYRFANGDGQELQFHIDGQAEHALERIFGNVMKQMGYKFLWRRD
jgi:hypothetical protein